MRNFLTLLVILAVGLLAACGSSREEPIANAATAIVEATATATPTPPSAAAASADANNVAPLPTVTLAPRPETAPPVATPTSGAPPPPTATLAAAPAGSSGTGGTVLAARLNVRAGAGTQERQIGALTQGARVQVLGRQGDWLQIAFEGGPGGAGWVSASYVAVDGEAAPATPTSPPRPASTPSQGSAQRVPAPRAVSYQDPTFTWEWGGLNQVGGAPWYFDIQIYSHSGSDPYDVIPATLAQVRQEGGVWKLDHRYQARCDSYWVVQVARGAPGNYQGWISERSNRQPIGEACPAPTPDCPGCGG